METEAVEGERLGEPGKGVIDRRGGRGGGRRSLGHVGSSL